MHVRFGTSRCRGSGRWCGPRRTRRCARTSASTSAGSSTLRCRSAVARCRPRIVPVIISFGAPVRLFDAQRPVAMDRLRQLHDRRLRHLRSGRLERALGRPADQPCRSSARGCSSAGRCSELTNRAVALDDLFGRDARRLTAFYDAPTWEARFTILDRELASRILTARAPSAAVTWTWRRLVETGGRVSIGSLVDEVGFSQKHLIAQFREQIGLSPKTLARVLRFGRAVRDHQERRRRPPGRDRAGLRLLRPGALLARLPRLRRRHADRAGAKPAARRRRLRGRQVRFVQDPLGRLAYAASVEDRFMKPNIFPALRYKDGHAAIDWLVRTFGFEKHVRLRHP